MVEGIEFKDKKRSIVQPWLQLRLKKDQIDFLKECINVAEQTPVTVNGELAGNIHKSLDLIDKDKWFFETVLKKLSERMFYRDWNNYYKYCIDKEESPPEFAMGKFWVNYQRETEFNPLHDHSGLYSFVIFIKIPTKYEEQHSLPISANSNSPTASDFQFVWTSKDIETCHSQQIPLNPEDGGKMFFFKANLQHQVYPFYGTKEERITISGNIFTKEDAKQVLPGNLQEQVNKYMEEQQGQR